MAKRRLAVALVLFSLLSPVFPAGTVAATEGARWSSVNVPTEGRPGNWVLAAGSDVLRLAQAVDGSLYAAVSGVGYTLFKSINGGYAWSYVGNVRDNIVDIATSPRDANWLYYATASTVYRSSDAGKTFVALPGNPGGAGAGNIEITSIAVSWQNAHVVVVGTRDNDSGQFGGVYTISEDRLFSGWTDAGLVGYDVCAVSYAPGYAGDRQVIAVATNETDTYVLTRYGSAGWGATLSNARLSRDNSFSIVATSAQVSFPNDYSADAANSVVYVGVAAGGNGDVYQVSLSSGISSAADLSVGSGYGLRNVDVAGIAVVSHGNSAKLLAGANASSQTYSSADGGRTWTRSEKEPTGGSRTRILVTGKASYAATSGPESGVSASTDNGLTWNQVGLIDTTMAAMVDFAPSPAYSQDETMFLLTFGGKHSLWRATAPDTWERVFSSALRDVDSMAGVKLSPTYRKGAATLFVVGSSGGNSAIWQSTDNGQKFNRRFALDPSGGGPMTIDAWAVAGDSTLIISSYDGANSKLYRSDNAGFIFAPGVVVGTQPVNALSLSPEFARDGIVLAGGASGGVYRSTDNGSAFESIPPFATTPPLAGLMSVAFDPRFASNRTVYAASATAGRGIHRFVLGKSAAWESIDSTMPTGATFSQLLVSADGVLFAANSKSGTGMERALDPTYTLGPVFETVKRDLNSNATLAGLWQSGNRVWAIDTTVAQLLSFADTLTSPPAATYPAEASSGLGSLSNHTIRNVRLDWQTVPEATSYQWQLSYNQGFNALPTGFEGTTDGSSANLPTLEPGTTYYWRVRASAPVLSPWSAKRSFTTALDTEVVPLKLLSPQPGAAQVPTTPLFQWSPIAGADGYEFVLSAEPAFSSPSINMTGDKAVPTTAWQCDRALKGEATFYWKVRAVSRNMASAWSPVSSFTTDVPTLPTRTPAPIRSQPPQPEFATPRPSPIPQSTLQPFIPTPTPPAPSVTQQPAPQPTTAAPQLPVMTIFNWMAYFIGGLLVAIMLLLVILLVMVVRMRR